ncbi:ECF transporter S component [Treponema sp.]|uniref:ECF transporter S component n=1 Tax=Treponema sp. TaxID=166 RepID=UPI003F07E931
MEKNSSSLNYKIALSGVFSALSILLAFTPLGYIQLGGAIQITLMHVPVIIATLLAGLVPGLVTGFVFGTSSLVKALMTGAGSSLFFMNPVVSVLPRLLFPVAVWAIFALFNCIPHFPKVLSGIIAAAFGTFFHTVVVMGAIFLLYGDKFIPMINAAIKKLGLAAETLSGFKAFAAVIATTMITNGFFEVLCAVILTGAVLGTFYAAGSRKSKLSKLEE